MFEHILIYKSI